MGSRATGEGTGRVYDAAQLWIKRALRADDSLFTQGVPIWSKENLEKLRQHFADLPPVPGASFYENLQRQLEGSEPETCQLMAEVLYVHLLFTAESAMKGDSKVRRINQVLKWSARPVTIPEDLGHGLTPGLGHPGVAFIAQLHVQVGYLIDFVNHWKSAPSDEREQSLKDPWAFKRSLHFEISTAWLQHCESIYALQQAALLHLVFPDTFEKVISATQKNQIADAFAQMVVEPTEDIDRKLQQIRKHLESEHGPDVDFYLDPIHPKWNPVESQKAWDEFVNRARAFVEAGDVDRQENHYKVEIGQKLEQGRTAVFSGADDWADLVKSGLTGNIIYPIQLAKLRDWIDDSPDQALRSFQAIWTGAGASLHERIRTFLQLLPKSVIAGPGTRTTVVSQVLMGLDVYRCPPFRITLFNETYDQVGYPRPQKGADEVALYEHALGFLDRFIEEAAEREVDLEHRLDAQSLVWMIAKSDPPGPTQQTPDDGNDLTALAKGLFLQEGFLQEIETLLKDKKQVIFQGPPGTGKTYVAQKLAACLAGTKERVTLVQFHPSYAYEDFVQGYRPSPTDDGQPGFTLRNGPLLTAAERARKDPEADHFLVIDEINRGNLAKLFGELYFLLEYRGQKMRLQYQAEGDEEFSLPENLYIIGTMNTADRSIALVDLALRRRFYFVEFHPDDEPIKSLLRKWLQAKASGMGWVADVIDVVNKKLENDRHVAVGPSYFMGTDSEGNAVVRDKASVQRIWKHSVLPYIEEHLFGSVDSLAEWDLDKLRNQAKGKTQGNGEITEDAVRDDAPA